LSYIHQREICSCFLFYDLCCYRLTPLVLIWNDWDERLIRRSFLLSFKKNLYIYRKFIDYYMRREWTWLLTSNRLMMHRKKNDEFYIKKINDMMMRSTKPTLKSLDIIDNEKSWIKYKTMLRYRFSRIQQETFCRNI